MAAQGTKDAYEYIVVGLGGLGSGAAYWLARRGADVLGIEQYALGHDKGASGDHSRIIRLAYEKPEYVELARHSYAAWAEVEQDAGEQLIVVSGGLDIFPPGGSEPPDDFVDSMNANDVPFEQLAAAELMRRFPQFRVADGTVAIYQAQGGIAPALKCTLTHQRLARKHGATLLDNTPVTALAPRGDGVEVTTPDGVYRCRRLIVAADAWTNELLQPFGVRLPLTSTQEQVAYYASPQLRDFHPDRFPIWIWRDNPCFYGVPVYGEMNGVKVAQDLGGDVVTPQTRTFVPNAATLARVEAFMRRTLPTITGAPVAIKTCMYTMPPDRDFIVDTLPDYPQVAIAVGAGHAFKFSSIIGRILSELALDGTTPRNIAPFAIDRPQLTTPHVPRVFDPFLEYNKQPVAL